MQAKVKQQRSKKRTAKAAMRSEEVKKDAAQAMAKTQEHKKKAYKKQVKAQSTQTMKDICEAIDNIDLKPFLHVKCVFDHYADKWKD